jgi:hypothetical protein
MPNKTKRTVIPPKVPLDHCEGGHEEKIKTLAELSKEPWVKSKESQDLTDWYNSISIQIPFKGEYKNLVIPNDDRD